jgi:hypothetical protein
MSREKASQSQRFDVGFDDLKERRKDVEFGRCRKAAFYAFIGRDLTPASTPGLTGKET